MVGKIDLEDPVNKYIFEMWYLDKFRRPLPKDFNLSSEEARPHTPQRRDADDEVQRELQGTDATGTSGETTQPQVEQARHMEETNHDQSAFHSGEASYEQQPSDLGHPQDKCVAEADDHSRSPPKSREEIYGPDFMELPASSREEVYKPDFMETPASSREEVYKPDFMEPPASSREEVYKSDFMEPPASSREEVYKPDFMEPPAASREEVHKPDFMEPPASSREEVHKPDFMEPPASSREDVYGPDFMEPPASTSIAADELTRFQLAQLNHRDIRQVSDAQTR